VSRRQFANDARAARAARVFVAEALDDVDAETREAALLMTSELATNSVRHAHTGFTVTVDRVDNQIRVAVEDRGTSRPTRRSPSPREPSGRGLGIVAALAAQWGSTVTADGGNCVWFTVPVATVTEMH